MVSIPLSCNNRFEIDSTDDVSAADIQVFNRKMLSATFLLRHKCLSTIYKTQVDIKLSQELQHVMMLANCTGNAETG